MIRRKTRKQLIVFDLDGTLAPSKSPLPDRMSELLNDLLARFQVCVISGGKYELFQRQLLANLPSYPERLANLHLMPTNGTRYYAFEPKKSAWHQVYAENLTRQQKSKITKVLYDGLDELRWRPKQPWGELIEDRGSQITLSALGQEAPIEAKEAWDPTGKKKEELRLVITPKLPEFEVRSAGTTSIDVTKPGIDKAYGIRKLMQITDINKAETLFLGDRLAEGGNDYPVKAMGIDCLEVSHWEDTALIIQAILYVA